MARGASQKLTAIACALVAAAGCGYEAAQDVITRPFNSSSYDCDHPTADPVGSVELAAQLPAPSVDGGAPDLGVVLSILQDGDAVELVRGGQGANMIVLRLVVAGGGGQTCVFQQTRVVSDSGAPVSRNGEPLALHPQADGTAMTADVYFPGAYPATFSVTATLGAATVTRHLQQAQ